MSDAARVLVIDDDPDILTYVSEILQDNAYETSTAADGEAGLASVRQARPDLVILDLMMPRKSGIRFLNEIRRDASLRDVPILVLSGATGVTGVDMRQYLHDQPFRERKEKALGVAPDITPDAYLDKPVDPAVLLETVRKLIGR
ncbi:MAG: response regulator [Gemmatimonadota bacterium]